MIAAPYDSSDRISCKLRAIAPSATYAILAQVHAMRAQGARIFDMGGGEPCFPTPEHISSAAVKALLAGDTHYTSSRGVPELRAAIAQRMSQEHGIAVDAKSQVVVTPSAKHGLFAAISAAIGDGDEMIIPTPSWVSYKAMAELAGGKVVELPLTPDAEGSFRITTALLEARRTDRTRALLVNSPNNPTGHMLTQEEAMCIVDFAQRHDLIVISDEIYDRIAYDGRRHICLASLPGAFERTLTINGFSKSYAMTGWRLGYVVGPEDLLEAVDTVNQHTVGCAGSFIQAGGIAALKGNQGCLDAMLETYATNRRIIVDTLCSIPGVYCKPPDGAFYAFAQMEALGLGDSCATARWLLENTGVVAVPGSAFGDAGEGWVRFAFAGETSVVEEAARRLFDACKGIHR
jgi:aspartate aminotransferase